MYTTFCFSLRLIIVLLLRFPSFLYTYSLFSFNVSSSCVLLLWWNISDIISISCSWVHLSWGLLTSSTLSWLLFSCHLDLHLPSSPREPFTFLQSCFLFLPHFDFLFSGVLHHCDEAPPSITSWESVLQPVADVVGALPRFLWYLKSLSIAGYDYKHHWLSIWGFSWFIHRSSS